MIQEEQYNMDKMLARINELYPNCGYVQIRKYDPTAWEGIEYDSKLENKAPLTQWKTSALSYEQAQKYAEQGWRIGWIIPEGYVVVDIDNEDHPESSARVERILHSQNIRYSYNRTSRGVHFFFKDNNMSIVTDAITKCSLGITVDHRANRKGYIILPINDPHRSWGEWNSTVDNIPFFLKPIMIAKNQIESFIGMRDGDGRNDAMFKWRTKLLQSGKLHKEQIEQSLRLINEHLFKEPLAEKEMVASVTKARKTDDEQMAKAKKVKLNVLEKENIYNMCANRITREFDIICIGHKQYYMFDKSYYRPLREIDVERLIHYEISENIPAEGRKEIMKFLALKTLVDANDVDRIWNKIAVKNGILDLVTGELTEPDKNEKNTIAIPWNYNPNPMHSPRIDEFMAHISANRDGTVNLMKQQFLYQIAGYCLLKKNYFGKFFIFQGDGQTGKSTFQDLIVKMVGEENRARVGIDKMDADYYLATLLSKLVNIDDDAVDGKVLENTGRFKSLVSGNEITVRQIFKEPVTFTPFATCMFSCNKLPRILDKTSGLYRRLVIIELNNKITKPDPLFLMKLTERDMEYFLFKAVYWIGVALQEGKFRISQSEQELLRKFKCRQSSLNEWVYEEGLKLKDIYGKGCLALYSFYLEWAQKNGYTKLPSVLTFKEDICVLYNVEVNNIDPNGKASGQIFTRRIEPTKSELEEVPF
jgi:putative DNA primase/helicase